MESCMKKKKIALVLSGGSAYGFAHIGILKILLENNVLPDIIVGTSMGAIIGGLFASGISIDEMENILTNFSRSKIVDISLFTMFKKGLLQGSKVTKILEGLIGDKNIEDCPIKFACISSDLRTGEKVVFSNGNMVTAIRSSMSVPGIFSPVELDGRFLVDGGVADNLPVDVARDMGADVVIAVDVCSYYRMQNELKSTIDIVVSASNLCVANFVLAQKDKGDVYIKIDQPNVSFDKYTVEDITASIDNGVKAAQSHLEEILSVVKNGL